MLTQASRAIEGDYAIEWNYSRNQICDRTELPALKAMRQSFHEVTVTSVELETLQSLVALIPNWQGSLEEAIVILYAQKLNCPVWTLNYRDFGAFTSLSCWNP